MTPPIVPIVMQMTIDDAKIDKFYELRRAGVIPHRTELWKFLDEAFAQALLSVQPLNKTK